jgi:hypothetical protein
VKRLADSVSATASSLPSSTRPVFRHRRRRTRNESLKQTSAALRSSLTLSTAWRRLGPLLSASPRFLPIGACRRRSSTSRSSLATPAPSHNSSRPHLFAATHGLRTPRQSEASGFYRNTGRVNGHSAQRASLASRGGIMTRITEFQQHPGPKGLAEQTALGRPGSPRKLASGVAFPCSAEAYLHHRLRRPRACAGSAREGT